MTPLGIGTDLSGSIRAPAGWTGVFGLRSGRDALPFPVHHPLPAGAGMLLFGTAGPMARSAADLDAGARRARRAAGAPPGTSSASPSSRTTACSRSAASAARRSAARPPRSSDMGIDVVEERPPRQADLRAAFDVVLAHEVVPGDRARRVGAPGPT